MKYEDIEIGQRVIIKQNLDMSSSHFGLTQYMIDMRGEIVIVDDMWRENSDTPIIRIKGFNWHPHDLKSIDETLEEKPENIFYYNPEELVI